jgi:transposase-like protein
VGSDPLGSEKEVIMAQVWLITGCSRGLGLALAEAVLAAGHSLVATARNPAQLADLVERHGDRVRALTLDVTDPHAAVDAVGAAVGAFGRLDVLVNNAGGSWKKLGGWPFPAISGCDLLAFLVVHDPSLGAGPMDFPIIDLMDQEGCRNKLFDLLHPEGHFCPSCGAREGLTIHRRHPDSPVVDYRCKACRRVFNMFTGTQWQGTHLNPAQILLILRGVAQGVPTAKLAREVGISRQHLLKLRHRMQANALDSVDHSPLPDDQTEADEMYQNAGEKRGAAQGPRRPAASPSQPGQGPRHLGDGPAAGPRGGRAGQQTAVVTSGSPEQLGRVG